MLVLSGVQGIFKPLENGGDRKGRGAGAGGAAGLESNDSSGEGDSDLDDDSEDSGSQEDLGSEEEEVGTVRVRLLFLGMDIISWHGDFFQSGGSHLLCAAWNTRVALSYLDFNDMLSSGTAENNSDMVCTCPRRCSLMKHAWVRIWRQSAVSCQPS